MDKLGTSSREARRARTRSMIQLAGLIEKAGLVETFDITLGEDLQKSPEQKLPVAGLFKGLVVLNEIAQSDEVSLPLWQMQGLQLLGDGKRENSKHAEQ